MSTTLSTRPSSFISLGDAWTTVKKLFQPVAPADAASVPGAPDVWQLYRLSRGSDSVRPALVKKLAEIAAS